MVRLGELPLRIRAGSKLRQFLTLISAGIKPRQMLSSATKWMMEMLRATRSVVSSWFVIGPIAAILGVVIGALVLAYAFPGKPNIAVINIPYTVISEGSAYVIGEYLSYAERDDSIKAVVIRLTTPGGSATASERLYVETRKLREKKPVVVILNGLVASGGYMMAMGSNHTYAQTSSLIGNVGAITLAGPLIPGVPSESIVFTGPYKLTGASRRDWFAMTEQLKSSFAQMVISERGERLRMSEAELVEGRIYSGIDAVSLGLADDIGGDSDAIEKAAELARISNYGLVDVNSEVQREFILRVRRIFAAHYDGEAIGMVDPVTLLLMVQGNGDPLQSASGLVPGNGIAELQALRKLMLAGGLDMYQENPLPEFPLDIRRPNVYYLYTGYDD